METSSNPLVQATDHMALCQLLLSLQSDHQHTILQQAQKINYQHEEIEKLRFQLNKQLAHRFGSQSEKGLGGQLNLFDEANLDNVDVEEIKEADACITISGHTRNKQGRKPLPADLPREDIIHDLAPDERACACGQPLHKIGEDISEQLEIIPARFKVLRHVRYKYGCRACEGGIISAALPNLPIPKSIAAPGLLAHIIVSKLTDHLPLYRQERILQRQGISIARATLCYWVVRCAQLLSPIVDELKQLMLKSHTIQADETTLQVLNEPGRANYTTSYLWVYRAIGPPAEVGVVVEYAPTRAGAVAEQFLQDFSGNLQTDGYGGYNNLRKREGIRAFGCLAHCRRKYTDILKTNKRAVKAQTAVNFIAKLYAIEKQARVQELSAQQRGQLRQEKSLPILARFKQWLEKTSQQVPPKSPIGGAIAYTLKQWFYVTRYVEDGRVEIDTNHLENTIRPLALGRRNWLFSGSVEGAQAMAILYSLQQTAKAYQLEPYAYFKTILQLAPDCKTAQDFRQLLPQFIDRDLLSLAYQ